MIQYCVNCNKKTEQYGHYCTCCKKHVLKRLQPSKKLVSDFYVWDTETTHLEARPEAFILGVVYGHNYMKAIYSVDEFKEEFKHERYRNKKVFAHSAEYDLGVIYENIYWIDPDAVFNNRFICATNGNCTFGDSFNIYDFGVRQIGEYLGLAKSFKNEQYDRGFGELLRTGEITLKEIEQGCIRDCEILYEALFIYFEEVSEIKLTKASLSMAFFRRNFLKHHLFYNKKLNDDFFDSYFGGRVECFYIGKVNNGVAYDFNSMYPYAMKNALFPNPRDLKKVFGVSVKKFLRHFIIHFEGMAKLTVHHKEVKYGYLPVRGENAQLIFPVGTFTGSWNFPEIRLALEHGVIEVLAVHSVTYARPMRSIFPEAVDYLYNKKKTAENDLKRQVNKYNLNCLFGKFGQKNDTETRYLDNIENYLDEIQTLKNENKIVKIIPFNAERLDCFIQIKKPKSKTPAFCIASIPSYITSYSRARLLDHIIKYDEYSPLYCDTDSIFFLQDPGIISSNELGELGLENKKITEIRGLKNYTFEENGISKDKIKGVPKKAIKIGENLYTFKTLVRTKQSLRRNIDAGIEIDITKKLNNKYRKRHVFPDGKTKPLKL